MRSTPKWRPRRDDPPWTWSSREYTGKRITVGDIRCDYSDVNDSLPSTRVARKPDGCKL
jgi:hypothetical protein